MTNQEQYELMCRAYEMTVNKMNNKEWIDFLVQQFEVSRTTARNMLHVLMKMKKYDNINIEYIKEKAVDHKPKTGHWIASGIPDEKYVCSECGGACWYYDYKCNVAKSRYCPNCGAKMIESKV